MATSQIYSEDLSNKVLDLLRDGNTLAEACRQVDIPTRCVYGWKGKNTDKFADRYHHACQDRALRWADEILEIADDCPPRDIDIKRAALKIRSRQWLIEKQAPNLFGAVVRVNQEENLPVISPVDFLKSWKEKHGSPMPILEGVAVN